MKLWFDNGYYARVIANVETEKDAILHIRWFCAKRSYKIHYIRRWKENTARHECKKVHYVYDVGSHTQFFCLETGK